MSFFRGRERTIAAAIIMMIAVGASGTSGAAEPIDCPPKGSLERDRLKYAGELCKDEQAGLKARQAKIAAAERSFRRRPLPPVAQAQIRRFFNLRMIDGESARYLWPEQRDPYTYCGFINAKNQVGGYVGWRLFWANLPVDSSDELLISTAGSSKVMDGIGQEVCQEEGYPIYSEDVDKK